eukprot:scaffold194976_cov26-Tisochrysis_lutea.AAC.1
MAASITLFSGLRGCGAVAVVQAPQSSKLEEHAIALFKLYRPTPDCQPWRWGTPYVHSLAPTSAAAGEPQNHTNQ